MSRRRSAGFTLLEMLVAVSVLGLLSMSIARGLSVGSFAWARASMHNRDAARLRDARQLLQAILGGAYPAFASANLDDHRIAFAGGPEEINLITRLPQALGFPEMVAARLSVSDRSLIMSWRLDLPDAERGGPLPETVTVLIPGIGRAHFEYFSATTGWQNNWTGAASLPQSIRVQVEDAESGKGTWASFVAEPRVTANSACLYDATDIQCRRLN